MAADLGPDQVLRLRPANLRICWGIAIRRPEILPGSGVAPVYPRPKPSQTYAENLRSVRKPIRS
jgi:hypothetical protein